MGTERPPTLAELLRRRIETAYGGNQAAFARALGVKPQKLSSWLTERAVLPEASSRRLLAKELGVRHVDILVAAGELWPDEVAEVARSPEPSEIEAILQELPERSRQNVLWFARQLLDAARAAEVANAPAAASPELAAPEAN